MRISSRKTAGLGVNCGYGTAFGSACSPRRLGTNTNLGTRVDYHPDRHVARTDWQAGGRGGSIAGAGQPEFAELFQTALVGWGGSAAQAQRRTLWTKSRRAEGTSRTGSQAETA